MARLRTHNAAARRARLDGFLPPRQLRKSWKRYRRWWLKINTSIFTPAYDRAAEARRAKEFATMAVGLDACRRMSPSTFDGLGPCDFAEEPEF